LSDYSRECQVIQDLGQQGSMSSNRGPAQATGVSTATTTTVLHVRTVAGAGGGADKTTLKSAKYLEGTAYRAKAAYLHAPADPGFAEIRRRAREWGCPLIEIADRGALDPTVIFALAKVCRQLGVRIWHAHEYKSNVIGILLRPFLGLHLVSTVHGWVEFGPRLSLFYKLDRWALRRYDKVIAVSPDIHDACVAAGVRPDRLVLIYNAIELDAYRRQHVPAQASGRRTESPDDLIRPVPPGRRVVGAVGRLSAEKGFDLLIDAFAKLCRRGFDLELWIAGEGQERQALERCAAQNGCRDRIVFLGFHSDARRLFECFDAFCLPSLREGLPNVVLEAMAMEVPIVATTVGGVARVLRPEEDAILVAPGSAAALESGLIRLLESDDLCQRLVRAARAQVERNFDFRARMRKVVAVYDALLAAPVVPG